MLTSSSNIFIQYNNPVSVGGGDQYKDVHIVISCNNIFSFGAALQHICEKKNSMLEKI